MGVVVGAQLFRRHRGLGLEAAGGEQDVADRGALGALTVGPLDLVSR